MLSQIILAAIAVALALVARKSRPASNQQGVSLNDAASKPPSKDLLNVATFNIQTGKSLQGKRDVNRSAAVLAQADIAGVQEVYAPKLVNLAGLSPAQSPHIAKRGGFAWLFCATRRRWLREHRGNLILSKLPVDNWRIEMLPDQSGRSFRNMTIVEARWQGQKFHFINTHLHTRQGREEQLDIVLREFAKYPRAILLGDFNTRGSAAQMQSALANVEITDAIAAAGLDMDNPERIDWILTKGFSVHSGKFIEKGISDHPYYQVSLSINSAD